MGKLRALGVVAVVMCGLGATVATSAFAESEWLVDGAAVPSTAKVHVEIKGPIIIRFKGVFALACEASGLGTVWESTGEIEEYNVMFCKTIEGSCVPQYVSLNLNWLTELVLVAGQFKNKILNGGKGVPGWEVACFGFIVGGCGFDPSGFSIENMGTEAPADVLEHLTAITECAGEMSGELLIAALEGLALAVS